MIDIGKKLRTGYFSLLNGNITIDGSPIPIVDEKLDALITDHDIYVVMSDQNERRIPNKTKFIANCDMSFIIVNKRNATASKEVVEEVSNQLLGLVFPTVANVAVSVEAPLRLSDAYLDSADYAPIDQMQDGFAITKTLIIKNTISQ